MQARRKRVLRDILMEGVHVIFCISIAIGGAFVVQQAHVYLGVHPEFVRIQPHTIAVVANVRSSCRLGVATKLPSLALPKPNLR